MNFLKLWMAAFFLTIFQATIAQERTRKVKMPKYYKASIPADAMAVAGIQVIHVLPDSTRLGFLQKGLANQKVTAVPEENMTTFLQEYIDKQYKDDYKKEGVYLLWMIKDLRINERTFFSTEKAFARLHADAYVSKDGRLYKFVTTLDTVRVYSSMMDVTSSHGENIAGAFQRLLLQSVRNADMALSDSSQYMATDNVIAFSEKRFRFPIITDTVFKEGAYMNFNEFLQNSPSLSNYEVLASGKKDGKIRLFNKDGEKKDIIPWGICKSGELYKYYDNELIAIERNGNGFIISDYVERVNRRNQGIFGAAFLGGAIGAAIANSSAHKLYNVTTISYITKKQPEASCIDMETGELTF